MRLSALILLVILVVPVNATLSYDVTELSRSPSYVLAAFGYAELAIPHVFAALCLFVADLCVPQVPPAVGSHDHELGHVFSGHWTCQRESLNMPHVNPSCYLPTTTATNVLQS